MRKNNKYPDGYRTKIQYWTGKLKEAIADGDFQAVINCNNSIEYFISRQLEVYG